PLPVAVVPGSLEVRVNGVETGAVAHAGGELVFDTAPPDAAVVDVRYLEDRGPILTYDLAIADGARLAGLTDAATGEPVTGFSLSGAVLTLDADEFAPGR